MLKPTNDPLEVMRRKAVEDDRRARAALEAGGTEPFQAVRKLQQALADLTQVVADLAGVVALIPITRAAEHVGGEFSPTGSWVTVATVTIPRPAGKPVASVMAQAGVGLNWSVTPGDAWPAVSARIMINGDAGPAMPLSQGISDAGGGVVTGRMAGAANRARVVTGSADVVAQLQVAVTGWIGDGPQNATFSGGLPQVAAMVAFAPEEETP